MVAAVAQEASEPTVIDIEQIVVTGTRVADRSAIETAVPVDVVSGEALANVGVTEINQALSVMLPSFNFPRPGLADGTDTIRPATLRGLAPDQTLVLVNSKRRHASSLVNVNGTIGRGSAAVDLNTIPAAIVQSIEVLRDGASAQYGSDAIAGVINVRLKQDSDGGDVMVAYGARDFDYDIPVGRRARRRDVARAVLDRQQRHGRRDADRVRPGRAWLRRHGLPDARRRVQGPGAHRARRLRLPPAVSARRHAHSIRARPTFDRFNAWYGEPELEQLTLFANAGYELDGGVYHLRLGELSGPRIALGRLLPARARRPQRHPDLSGRLPADHRARRHGLQRGGRRDVGARPTGTLDTSLDYGTNEMEFASRTR